MIAVGRDEKKAATLLTELAARAGRAERSGVSGLSGSQPVVVSGDVATEAGCRRFADTVAAATDHVDALINNAGLIAKRRRVTDEGREQLRAQFAEYGRLPVLDMV